MNRAVTVLVAASTMALVTAGAVGASPPRDMAVGGANNTNGFFQIGFSAHSEPLGEDPTGHVSARSRPQSGFPVPFRFGGEVTCLRVSGNRAIKYRFDRADNPLLVGGGIETSPRTTANRGTDSRSIRRLFGPR